MSSANFNIVRYTAKSSWDDDQFKHDALTKNISLKLCNEVLDAPTFDVSATRLLAARDMFPFAVAALLAEAGRDERLLKAFYNPISPSVEAFRWGCFFQVISRDETRRFTLEDLRTAHTDGGALALAALGEIDWSSAPRTVRAVFVLRALIVEARRP